MNSIESVKLKNVEVQINGIIRNEKGMLIGRLVDGMDYKSEHVSGLATTIEPTPHNKLIEEKVQKLEADLRSPHTKVGLLLNSELACPHKGETAGSMKERLIPHLMEALKTAVADLLATRDAQMIEAVEEEVPEFSGKSDYSVGWNDARKRVLMFLRPQQQEEV
jgi:hypothetical protein